MKDFKGNVAVITGAASGIGLGLAWRCAEEGMKVVLADIDQSALNAAEKRLKAKGTAVIAVRTDVSRLADVEALAQQTISAFGGVHLLFNNAGVQVGVQRAKPLWENTMADWQWVTGVNLWGVAHGVKVFVPIMLKQGTQCHIVNTASAAGLTTGTEIGIYRITKSAVIMLSETLCLQLKQCGATIGVSVLCPSSVQTNLNEAERNRPAELSNPPEKAPLTSDKERLLKRFQTLNQNARSTEQFTAAVFKAIEEEKLYVLTHPELNAMVKQRTDNMIEGKNPVLN